MSLSQYSSVLGDMPIAAPAQAVNTASVMSTTATMTHEQKAALVKTAVIGLAGGVVGAVAGYKMWKTHHWLGMLTGFSVGGAVYPLAAGPRRKHALGALVSAATAVGASKAWKKHPIWGWVLGGAAGSIVSSIALPEVLNK